MAELPVIYDPRIEAMRPITQAEVDQLVRIAAWHAKWREAANDLHAKLTDSAQ